MPILLSDEEIEALVLEPKLMPDGLFTPKMAVRNSHRHKSYEISCDTGHLFVVKIRESCVNPMNFSVILGYILPGVYTVFFDHAANDSHGSGQWDFEEAGPGPR